MWCYKLPNFMQTPSRGVPLPDESPLRKQYQSNGDVGTVGEYEFYELI